MAQGLLCALLHPPAEPVSRFRTGPPPSSEHLGRSIAGKTKVAHMAKVAFLGLGVMGLPMEGHLVKKGGHDVNVFNRTAEKTNAWAYIFFDKYAATTLAVVIGTDYVILC